MITEIQLFIRLGKSSILVQFTDDTFVEDMGTTIGVDFKVKYITVDKKRVKYVY